MSIPDHIRSSTSTCSLFITTLVTLQAHLINQHQPIVVSAVKLFGLGIKTFCTSDTFYPGNVFFKNIFYRLLIGSNKSIYFNRYGPVIRERLVINNVLFNRMINVTMLMD